MKITVSRNKEKCGKEAANKAIAILKGKLKSSEIVRFVAATGKSQFEFLNALTSCRSIDWSNTEMFHLDEYVGLPETHPASFRRYLRERLVNKVHPGIVHYIKGDIYDPYKECERIGKLVSEKRVDLAFIGIGENGHIAFNDPPADFETQEPYIVVDLDEKCRMQQVGEGWFESIKKVPKKAISMSVNQIMESEIIICTCPDKRKAKTVRNCLSNDAKITPIYPASILKRHDHCYVFLDKESASLLE
jgi:glucosamine-6-phosphate deaminase